MAWSKRCWPRPKSSRPYRAALAAAVVSALLLGGCVRMTPEFIRGSDYERAVLLYQGGLLVEARETASRVSPTAPEARSAEVLRSRIDIKAKRFASMHTELAREFERSGIYPSALRQYRAARSYSPDDPAIEKSVARMEEAVSSRRAPDMAKALEPEPEKKKPPVAAKPQKPKDSGGGIKKLKAVQDADSLADVHYTRGRLYLESGEYQAAIREFEAVMVIMPGYQDTIIMLGEARSRMDGAVDTHLKKGIAYFQKEEMALAIKEWDSVLALDPQNQRAADYKARAELILERLEKIRERQGVREP